MSRHTREAWTDLVNRRELKAKAQKYGNQKIEIDGYTFDSKKEGNRYRELKLRVLAGEISDLRVQHSFKLHAAACDRSGTFYPVGVADYIADFTYFLDGRLVVEDVKSPATRRKDVYRLKRKIVEACHGIQIQEV